MAGFDDLVDVFVGLRLFLGDTPTRGTADDDATFCEAGAYRFTAGVAGGLVTGSVPAQHHARWKRTPGCR